MGETEHKPPQQPSSRFRLPDLELGQKLLQELLVEVESEEGPLSGGTKLGKGSEAVQALRESQLRFGDPKNNLIRLTPKLFEDRGVELSKIQWSQRQKDYDFYYLTLAVSPQPARGVEFRLLECSMELESPNGDAPILQAIFPGPKWKEVLRWGAGMRLAMTTDLRLEARDDEGSQEKEPPTDAAQAETETRASLHGFITIADYSFGLGRAEVVALGEGDSRCFWRLEAEELQQPRTVQFAVVFKVPKATQSIVLTALAAAEVRMGWLTAHLRHVFDYLSDKLKAMFGKKDEDRRGGERLPIGDHERWELHLPE